MIEVFKIEDFVINEMFKPQMQRFVDCTLGFDKCASEIKTIEEKIRRRPENIIDMLERNQNAKEKVFSRLRMFGVEFYRYLNMDNEIIKYVRKELENEL